MVDLKQRDSIGSYEMRRKEVFRHLLSPAQSIRYFLIEQSAIIIFILMLATWNRPLVIWVTFPVALLLRTGRLRAQPGWLLEKPLAYQPTLGERFLWKLSRGGKLFGAKGGKPGKGIVYLGNDKERWNRALWVDAGKLVTHIELFGTTGAGKTQWILGFLDQLLAGGSGCIFVDGKADVVTWFLMYTICRSLGREDDLLVINYLTAGNSSTGKQTTKRSNTNNPFSFGDSDSLMEMLSAMMGEAGGNDTMWRGRAEALGRAVLRALVELRDRGDMLLSVDTIRENLPLQRVESLAKDPRLSEMARLGLQSYLNELPGWNAKQSGGPAAMQAAAKADEQHGYLSMQFTAVLELLGATYKAITRTDLGEVDYRDVITNRRILYIMLPSIEKSPESLKNLGRMAVTNIRNALTAALGGAQLTGSRELLADARPTNAEIPFSVVLDEYGSYAVEGFADVAAQARSLGICTVFAGQDFVSFKKGSEIEAARIDANTGLKIFMKTESPETAELAVKHGGKSWVALTNAVQRHVGDFRTRYYDTGAGTLQEVDRISPLELAAQPAGEAHVIFGDQLWRVRSFYGDYEPVDYAQVNAFVRLRRPPLTGDGEPPEVAAHRLRKEWDRRVETLWEARPEDAPLPDADIEQELAWAYQVLDGVAGYPERADPAAMGAVGIMSLMEPEDEPAVAAEPVGPERTEPPEAGAPARICLEPAEDEDLEGAAEPDEPVKSALQTGHYTSVVLSSARQIAEEIESRGLDAWADPGLNITQHVERLVSDEHAYPDPPKPRRIPEDELRDEIEALVSGIIAHQGSDGRGANKPESVSRDPRYKMSFYERFVADMLANGAEVEDDLFAAGDLEEEGE